MRYTRRNLLSSTYTQLTTQFRNKLLPVDRSGLVRLGDIGLLGPQRQGEGVFIGILFSTVT